MQDRLSECMIGIGLALMGSVIALGMFCAGSNSGSDLVRREAVKANAGEFYLDDNRTIQFRWKIK